jgi:hypothetical protein
MSVNELRKKHIRKVSNIVHTSVDDAKSSLEFMTDLVELQDALDYAVRNSRKTLTVLIRRRIKKLTKAVKAC